VSLRNPQAFFDALRTGLLGPTLTAEEVKGTSAIIEAMEGSPLSWTAYALATAYRETASTMQPIREYGGPVYFTRLYDVTGARAQMALANGNTCAGDGPKYCGRGLVQLTWKNNYKRAGDKCGVDLVANPDLALKPDIAAKTRGAVSGSSQAIAIIVAVIAAVLIVGFSGVQQRGGRDRHCGGVWRGRSGIRRPHPIQRTRRSAMRKVPMRLSILLLAMLACAALCRRPPIVTTQRANCSSLIPDSWKLGRRRRLRCPTATGRRLDRVRRRADGQARPGQRPHQGRDRHRRALRGARRRGGQESDARLLREDLRHLAS
jgi:hypothetical protein